MAELNNTGSEKSLGEQMTELLKRKPQNYDVVFSVGPTRKSVKAVKFILKAASPVFEREFEKKWEGSVMKEECGKIPLPDLDPTVFDIFVKPTLMVELIILDSWSAEAVKKLGLPQDTLLSLLVMSHRFQVTKAYKVLCESFKEFLRTFSEFKDTAEFLSLSHTNLTTIISAEVLQLKEVDIFSAAFRWAEHQLRQKGMETTGSNYRKALGECLFEIRFPSMSVTEFTKIMKLKNILTAREKLDIFSFIGLEEEEKLKFDKSQLPFKANLRRGQSESESDVRQTDQKPPLKPLDSPFHQFHAISLTDNFKIVNSPAFVCDGKGNYNRIQTNKEIILHGLSFLGPTETDSFYDISVKIQKLTKGYWTYDSGIIQKRVFAQKNKHFPIIFDKPFYIKPNAYDSLWESHYNIWFCLKGPCTQRVERVQQSVGDCVMELEGVQFICYWGCRQMAQLLFTKPK